MPMGWHRVVFGGDKNTPKMPSLLEESVQREKVLSTAQPEAHRRREVGGQWAAGGLPLWFSVDQSTHAASCAHFIH